MRNALVDKWLAGKQETFVDFRVIGSITSKITGYPNRLEVISLRLELEFVSFSFREYQFKNTIREDVKCIFRFILKSIFQ
jgi:dihydroorotase-like cyclic amidohydrolase